MPRSLTKQNRKERQSSSPYCHGTPVDKDNATTWQSAEAIAQLPAIYDGKTETEVLQMKLPDRLAHKLDIVFVGINPGMKSAFLGHHYAGRNNHFWPCLRESGLIPNDFTFKEDVNAVHYGIGLTNIVERTTKCAADLTRSEIREGIGSLIEKIAELKPLVICFNGKGIFEIFSGRKCQLGLQADKFPKTNAVVYVMPSTSGRTISHPRRQDKLVFFTELRRLRDDLKGFSDVSMEDND